MNGYVCVLLSTTVVRGEGGSPGDHCYETGENQFTDSKTYLLLLVQHCKLSHGVT